MISFGVLLVILGAGSLVLPYLNLQFTLMDFVDPYQPWAGIIVAALGLITVLFGAQRRGRREAAEALAAAAPVAAVPAEPTPAETVPAEPAPAAEPASTGARPRLRWSARGSPRCLRRPPRRHPLPSPPTPGRPSHRSVRTTSDQERPLPGSHARGVPSGTLEESAATLYEAAMVARDAEGGDDPEPLRAFYRAIGTATLLLPVPPGAEEEAEAAAGQAVDDDTEVEVGVLLGRGVDGEPVSIAFGSHAALAAWSPLGATSLALPARIALSNLAAAGLPVILDPAGPIPYRFEPDEIADLAAGRMPGTEEPLLGSGGRDLDPGPAARSRVARDGAPPRHRARRVARSSRGVPGGGGHGIGVGTAPGVGGRRWSAAAAARRRRGSLVDRTAPRQRARRVGSVPPRTPVSEPLRVERLGPVARVVLARPDVRNAFNAELISALTDAFAALADEPRRRAARRGPGR